jgi:hypothetical protein
MAVISAPLDVVVCCAKTHHIEGSAEISQENCRESNQLHLSKSWGAI